MKMQRVCEIVGGTALRPGTASCEPPRWWYLNGGLGVAPLEQPAYMIPRMGIGFRVGATCGFRFNPRWAIEFDTGLIRHAMPTKPPRPAGQLILVPVVFNGIFHFPNSTRLEPFLGAGIGYVIISANDVTGGDVSLAFKGGLRHRINERTAIGIDYTYYMLAIASLFLEEAAGSHTVNLGVRRTF
jgi:hypothetical protein